MVSSPRLINYELMVIDFALDLLASYSSNDLTNRTTLEQDLIKFKKESDYRMKFIVQYNIERKKIMNSQVKLLKVLRAMLERIQVNQESF